MEEFIDELQSCHLSKENEYLKVKGLVNTTLTEEEEEAIESLGIVKWKAFNVEHLFGKSTRGKRLRSDDRIPGTLPFITAGEAEEGVSAL